MAFSSIAAPSFDFGTDSPPTSWRILNDGVMGGLSQGKIIPQDSYIRYEGRISLENNGGFSSIRSPWGKWDLSESETVRLRVRGNAKFALTLAVSPRWYEPNFKQSFQPDSEEWQEFVFPLNDFQPHRIGRKIGERMTPEQRQQVLRFGIITDEKQARDFWLEVDYLRVE
ncbi:MAG: CIA30 family protein [Bacteroidota bacterium]